MSGDDQNCGGCGDVAAVPELLSAANTLAAFRCAHPCQDPLQMILSRTGDHIKQLEADGAALKAANDELKAQRDALQQEQAALEAQRDELNQKLAGCEKGLDCCQKSRVIQFMQPNCGWPCNQNCCATVPAPADCCNPCPKYEFSTL